MKKKDNDTADVGSYIITYCSNCDNNVNHVVVAHNSEGIVARVKCIVCSSEHKYKRIKTRTVGKKTPSATRPRVSSVKLWEEAKTTAKNKVPIDYLITGTFEKDNLISHPKLGEGVVIKEYDNKIEVVFRDAISVLVHNRNE